MSDLRLPHIVGTFYLSTPCEGAVRVFCFHGQRRFGSIGQSAKPLSNHRKYLSSLLLTRGLSGLYHIEYHFVSELQCLKPWGHDAAACTELSVHGAVRETERPAFFVKGTERHAMAVPKGSVIAVCLRADAGCSCLGAARFCVTAERSIYGASKKEVIRSEKPLQR